MAWGGNTQPEPTPAIAAALRAEYERGQRDMRETDIEACRNLTLEADGETKPMPWRDVFADFLAALPINSEKEGG